MKFTEFRLRSKISAEAMQDRVAKILTDKDYDVLLTGPARVYKRDGTLLAVYLPGAIKEPLAATYSVLAKIGGPTENRGYASGTQARVKQGDQMRGKPVTSAIIGSFEASGYYKHCRLTSWTAKQMKAEWPALFPLFQACAAAFKEHVPDRYATQMKFVRETPQEWCIEGTPYTTVTVNDTYPTGVHKDAGDLDEGFSCLAVGREGEYTGGYLTFPEYRVAVDMRDGDLLLMDAHEWHSNTAMFCSCGKQLGQSTGQKGTGPCKECGARRISVVLYYRTNMVKCGTFDEEGVKAQAWAERISAGREEVKEQLVARAADTPPATDEQLAAEIVSRRMD